MLLFSFVGLLLLRLEEARLLELLFHGNRGTCYWFSIESRKARKTSIVSPDFRISKSAENQYRVPRFPPISDFPIFAERRALNQGHRYHDSAAGVSSKAKPRGVTACQIFAAASPTWITDPTLLPLKILATKSPKRGALRRRGGQACRPTSPRGGACRRAAARGWSPIVSFTVPIRGGPLPCFLKNARCNARQPQSGVGPALSTLP